MSYRKQSHNAVKLPAEVEEFVRLLRADRPGAELTAEPGGVKAKNWWLECSRGKAHVTVEWRPGRGFGISDPKAEAGYGEGPEEVFRDARLAVRRVGQWLLGNGAARPSWLRQLREVHGISQVELAERLKVNQAAVSRMENREDWKLATLLAVIEAMGGRIQLMAHFKNCDIPVRLAGAGRGATGYHAGPRKRKVMGR